MTATGQRGPNSGGGGAARVVVAGAGFGGLAAVRRLARAGTQTTLIDRNIYATFQPLLYEVASAGLSSSDVAYPARAVSRRHHAAFRHGELTGIDPAARQITLADGATLGYDYLILATGVAAAYHGVPGAAEYSLGLYTRHDAIVLRDRIMTGLEHLSLAGQRADVTVTVIGGGATGVELAGSIADLRNIALAASYPEIDRDRVHVALIEQAPALLGPFHPTLRDYTRRQLIKRGVDVRLGTAIREITPSQVVLADGSVLASDITVWAAGVAAPGAAGRWGLPQGRGGRLLVGPDLRAAGHDRIFAVGDIALIEDQPLPQLAQPALQMGKHAADQIRRLEAGQPTVPFRYRDRGTMATIGYRSAVVEFPRRVHIHGTLAWLAWLALHLITLLGGRNRISALVNMSWRYLTWRRGGGLIVGDGMTGLTPPEVPAGAAAPRQVTGRAGPDPGPGGSTPG
ncbi:MAG TPA: NAD(P)/FAD-dependent oxidoreductase [Streptosporangiaceae bacterium]|nr:NAD(P)/FAD-dependent oxidoreductase [Streptosporangiaceae bacterium]